MLKDLEQWAAIRKAILVDKVSRRQICRETGFHWVTVKKILKHEIPPGYPQRSPRPPGSPAQPGAADTYHLIDLILQRDRLRSWADRHTPTQIQALLRAEHGCDCALETVRRHVDRRTCSQAAIWDEVSELLRNVLGADSKEAILSLLPLDPRRLPLGDLRRLRRLLRGKQDERGERPTDPAGQVPGPAVRGAAASDWILRVLLGREPLSAVRAAVGDSPDAPVLYRAVRVGRPGQRTKALVVLARLKGISLRRIARTLRRRSLTAVARYWRTYREHGAKHLLNAKSRRATKTGDESIRKAVFEVLHSPPSAHDINRTTWKMDDLRRVLIDRGVDLSRETIRTIIKAAGYKWRKARTVLTSNDPEYREKLQRVTAVMSALKPGERFFSIDEFGPFSVKMRAGRVLAGPGEVPSVPQFQKSKGKIIMTAALELSTNQVTHFYSTEKNTGEMLKLLDRLLDEYAGCDKLYLSWDAASWHDSHALHARVAEVNAGTYRPSRTPQVEFVPLPSRAQFLNVIESVFSGMARAIIHGSNYESIDAAERAIDRHFRERNEHFRLHPKRAGKKIWGKEPAPSEFSPGNNCKDPRWCQVR